MGTFTVPLGVANLQGQQFIEVEALVDTGATYTSIPEDVLEPLGVEVREQRAFELADDRVVDYPVGYATMRVEDREVIFPVLSPKLVREGYEPSITRDHLTGIGEYADEDLLLYLIVTFNAESQEATANLKGPLFINQQTRMGRQVVIESDEYPLKYVFM